MGEGAGAKARGREDKAGGADGEGAEGAGGGAADSAGDAAGDGALERKPTLDAPSSSSAAAAANDAKAASTGGSTTDAQLISPFPAELPPYPSTFRTLDVAREVERVREARKRIRLGPEAYAPEGALIPATRGEGGGALGAGLLGERGAEGRARGAREDQRRGVGKPSVCLFTLHDTGDSCVSLSLSLFLLSSFTHAARADPRRRAGCRP